MAMDVSQRECALGYIWGPVDEGNPREWTHRTVLRDCPSPLQEWSPALGSELGWIISTSAKRERSAHSTPGAPYQALRLSCS